MKQIMFLIFILGINNCFASEVQLAPAQQIQNAKIHSQNLAVNWGGQLIKADRLAYDYIKEWDYRDGRKDTSLSLNQLLRKMKSWSVESAYRGVSTVNHLQVPLQFSDPTARSIIQGTISNLQQQVRVAKKNNGTKPILDRVIGEVEKRIQKIKTPAPIQGTSRRGGGGGGGKLGCGNPEIMKGANAIACRAFSIF